ncbi:MAG TPA: tetratricopeptide repeat protein [Chloroflexi bacterium]|nr:tetratricopeptide repeat protein [Chloroflexota bacterium]
MAIMQMLLGGTLHTLPAPETLMTATPLQRPSPSRPGTAPLEQHARRLYAAGMRMFEQSEWQAAARLFELVIKVNPEHLTARQHLGEALLEQGEAEKALRHLHYVYQRDPSAGLEAFLRALTSLANQYRVRGDTERARQVYRQVVKIAPDTPLPAGIAPLGAAASKAGGRLAPPRVAASSQREPASITPKNAASLREKETLGRGRITSLAYSPDGEILAVASSIGVYLYRLGAFRLERFLPAPAWVWSVAYAPDGAWLAAGMDDGRVRLWDPANPAVPVDIAAHNRAVRALAFSPEGTLLASGSQDGTARLWNTQTCSLQRTLQDSADEIRSLAFSPDGSLLALASENRHVLIRRIRDGALIHTLHGHRRAVRSVTFSSNGRWIASGGEDGRINFWHTGEEYPAKVLEDFMGIVSQVGFSPDNRLLVSASWDGGIRLWHPGRETIWQRLEDQRYPVSQCLFSPQGTHLSSLTVNEEVVRIWNAHNGELLKSLAHNNALYAVTVSPHQDYLAAGTSDGRVLMWTWPLHNPEPDVTLAGHQRAVRSVAFAPAGEYLVSGGDDPYLLVWKLSQSAAQRILLPPQNRGVTRLTFSPDGEWLFASTENGNIYAWQASDLWTTDHIPTEPILWAQYPHSVTDLSCAPSGDRLAAATDQGEGHTWAIQSRHAASSIRFPASAIRAIALSPTEGHIAAGNTRGGIHLWSLDGTRKHNLSAHEGAVRSLAFTPSGTVLASAGVDGRIHLWDAVAGVLLHTLEGHTQQIWQITFTPDGLHLLSASEDGTLRIWAADIK